MSVNMLVKAPKTFSTALPDAPTTTEQAIHDAIVEMGAEWTIAGSTATDNLWAVVTRSGDYSALVSAIKKLRMPVTVLHAQDSQKSPVLDKSGNPVLDKDGNPTYAVVVHLQGLSADILPFMPDIPIIDKKGNITGTKPATTVVLPCFGGHEGWVLK